MKRIPIAFAFDEDFLLPASVAIKSLIDSKNSDTEYKVFILHDGISEDDKKRFETITKIEWIRVPDEAFAGCPTSGTWNKIVYYRLLIPDLIKEYDKIIYSDIDVLFKQDLSEIYDRDIEDNYWAGVVAERNCEDVLCHNYFPENKNEFIYMSGFMLINAKKWREEGLSEKLSKNIEVFADRLKMFDLDLLNITCDNIGSVPFEYCVLENLYHLDDIVEADEYAWLSRLYSYEELLHAKNHPAIIHYAGCSTKIWGRKRSDMPDYYWSYIEKSPFYNSEWASPSIKNKFFRLKLYILSRYGFCKAQRKECRKKLNNRYQIS